MTDIMIIDKKYNYYLRGFTNQLFNFILELFYNIRKEPIAS